MPKQSLKQFAEQQHKKYIKQAWLEGVVAILPLVAIGVGAIGIATQPNAQEFFSPAKMGIGKFLFPILLIAYAIFLFFMLKDIRRRVRQR